jgi:hypothetical protein
MTPQIWVSRGRYEACLFMGEKGMGIERSDDLVEVPIWVVIEEDTGRELELTWKDGIDYFAVGMKVRLKSVETTKVQGCRSVMLMLQKKMFVEDEGKGKRVYGERDKGDDFFYAIWKGNEIEVHRCGRIGVDENADWLWKDVYEYDKLVFEVIE